MRLLLDLSTPSDYMTTPSDIKSDGVDSDGVDKMACLFPMQKKHSSWLASFLANASCHHNLTKILSLNPLWFIKCIITERRC